jgi:hypothetical protein
MAQASANPAERLGLQVAEAGGRDAAERGGDLCGARASG